MTVTLATANPAIRARSDHALWPAKPLGRVPVDPSVLFAGHAECSTCGAFVRRLTRLAERTVGVAAQGAAGAGNPGWGPEGRDAQAGGASCGAQSARGLGELDRR